MRSYHGARNLTVSLLAVLVALLLGAIPIALAGADPLTAYEALARGSLGSRSAIAETLVKTVPLVLVGLGVSVAFRARMWNIGAEGQLYIGAVAATAVSLAFPGLPKLVTLPLAIAASGLAGAGWAGAAGFLRVRFAASEIVSTLMLTYIAIQLVSYLVGGPWRDPGTTEPFTAEFASNAQLPILLMGTRLHVGIIVAAVFAIATWLVTSRTLFGYRIDIVGKSPASAEYGGIPAKRVLVTAITVSGVFAGVAGGIEVLGLHHRLFEHISPGYGFTGIAVAMLGRLNPLGVASAGLLFAALVVGADSMQQAAGVPFEVVFIVQSFVILFVLGAERLKVVSLLSQLSSPRGRKEPRDEPQKSGASGPPALGTPIEGDGEDVALQPTANASTSTPDRR